MKRGSPAALPSVRGLLYYGNTGRESVLLQPVQGKALDSIRIYSIYTNMFAYSRLVSSFRAGYFIGLVWLVCTACGKESDREQTATVDSSQTEASLEAPAVLGQYSPKFQKIVRNTDGMIRGVSVGDPLDEVKQQEKSQPMEDSTNYIGYNVELGNNEMTDILYYYNPDNGTVRNITLDVYLNDPQSVDSLMQEFNQYFTDKYGRPVIQEPKAVAWQDQKKTKIVLKAVGIPQAPGLRIQIAGGN